MSGFARIVSQWSNDLLVWGAIKLLTTARMAPETIPERLGHGTVLTVFLACPEQVGGRIGTCDRLPRS